jgi:hypothetical protein
MLASAIFVASALTVATDARATLIIVNSLADPGATGICALRDAITAANTKTATNGCAAGSGNDTIRFGFSLNGGTVALTSTLPRVTDKLLAIHPDSPNGTTITIDGGNKVQVMKVAPGTTLSLNYLTIADGYCPGCGGAAIVNYGNLTVINSAVIGNSDLEAAGGIFNNGTLIVTSSTFTGNSTADGAGGGIFNSGTLTVTNSTFAGNYCEGVGAEGGGIANNGGTLTVTNSTFSNNNCADGGGIFNYGTLSVTNSTFSSNSSSIANFRGLASVKSTILAASDVGNCAGRIGDRGYNISDDASCGFSATGSQNNVNPMLEPTGLQNNGGPTQTIKLRQSSPAIDAIPLAACTDAVAPPYPVISDQRFLPRPGSGQNFCDIGAFELQNSSATGFARFDASLTITSATGAFDLAANFTLGAGGSIDLATEPVTFGIGTYALRLPAGSFVSDGAGYLYHGTKNGVFLRLFLKPTPTPGIYALIAGGTVTPGSSLTGGADPVPVTLTIANNIGRTQTYPTFD